MDGLLLPGHDEGVLGVADLGQLGAVLAPDAVLDPTLGRGGSDGDGDTRYIYTSAKKAVVTPS